MQPSECCTFRASVLAVLGTFLGACLLWGHGAVTALTLGPFVGSAVAVVATGLFWILSLMVPCKASSSHQASRC